MAKRTRHIPPWFRLEKYSSADTLTLNDWHDHFLLRKNLLHEVRAARQKQVRLDQTGNDSNISVSSEAIEALAIIRETPLLKVSSNQLLRDYLYDDAPRDMDSLHSSSSPGVRLAKVHDLYQAEALCLDDDERNDARKYYDWLFAPDKSAGRLTYQSLFDRPVDDIADHVGGEILVRVNMLMPDSMLIDQFKEMLSSLRSPTNVGDIFFGAETRKPDPSRWVKYRILPYLDLRIWEEQNGKHILKHIMNIAVFPDGETGTDNMRKTISKLAEEVLSRGHIVSLKSLLSQNHAED